MEEGWGSGRGNGSGSGKGWGVGKSRRGKGVGEGGGGGWERDGEGEGVGQKGTARGEKGNSFTRKSVHILACMQDTRPHPHPPMRKRAWYSRL